MISNRLLAVLHALPLKEGIRVLEIGCGPGVLARAIANQIGEGFVLGIDRSDKAIQQAIKNSTLEIESGKLAFKKMAIENFKLDSTEPLFDLAVAIRVGALDGRHPELAHKAFANIVSVLSKKGKLFIDGPEIIQEIDLMHFKKN
ncbi:methyltransferase domain-containing protein [Flavihumibacter cheonanensis]|uniref:class I SAM-dependent methyltransferase n=1 Tax=Flavihumibacter cheonanensis TaxID=1442385 RepID=UPI001EF85A68|nr:class I SAM-dependent methyltransferase [Flavihumibacter cheonanensis]MCG7753702.1 class I SAM-dependent methyltransferase [Flavihumibacter cheonanensis]